MDERRTPREEGPGRLGEILLKTGLLDREGLREALALQAREGGRLGHLLVDRGLVDEQALVEALAEQLGLPVFDLEDYLLDPAVCELMDLTVCRHHRVLPLMAMGESLTVAMADPSNELARPELARASGRRVKVVLATSSQVLRELERVHQGIRRRRALRESLRTVAAAEAAEEDPCEGSDAADGPTLRRVV